jgi:translocation and assembly module TamB
LSFDLGDHLTFSGEGIETRLAGAVRVTTGPSGLIGKGSIRTVRGTYFAFGQRLDIDRGQLVFDGPLDNPGLDIVALRRNLAVEAGVAVTGTVKVPVIQLTSNPPVPDSEKLSWLVLGQASGDRSSGADLAALQAASAALLGSGGKPISASVAQSIGLDDISLRSHIAHRDARRARRGESGDRRRQAPDRSPDARLRAGAHSGDAGPAPRIRAHTLADHSRGGRHVWGVGHLFPADFRLSGEPAADKR